MKTSHVVLITAGSTFLITSGIWCAALIGWQAGRTASMLGALGGTGGPMSMSSAFSVTHRCPPEAELGKSIDLVLEITNTESTDQALESIDLYHDFLDGFQLTGASFSHTQDDMGDFETLWVEPAITIPAGGTESVTITLEAARPGTWSGDVDVCGDGIGFTTVVPLVEIPAPSAP